MMLKRGISDVVSTMFLIVIAVMAVGIISVFAVNFVNKNLSESDKCFEAYDKLSLSEKYSCIIDGEEVYVQVLTKDIELDKLLLTVHGGGIVKSIEIGENYRSDNSIRMQNTGSIEIPEENGGRTYVIDYKELGLSSIEQVTLSPIFGEKRCDQVANVFFVQCDEDIEAPQGACIDNEKRCNGNIVEYCSGGLWVEDTVCDTSLPYCYDDGDVRCVACKSDSDCPSSFPLCFKEENDHRCVLCIDDSDCPLGYRCDGSRNFCSP